MVTYDPACHHRRSIRLQGYDYSQNGAYFLTICVQHKPSLFGEVIGGAVKLYEAGQMVEKWWQKLGEKFPNVEIDEYVVMPNHFHGILFLTGGKTDSDLQNQHGDATVGATWQVAPTRPRGPKSGSIGAIIGQFKRKVTIRINDQRGMSCTRVWQRNYYERVVRNESSLNDIRSYIQTNPARWAEDEENPANYRQYGTE